MNDAEALIQKVVGESLRLKEEFFNRNAQKLIAFRDLLIDAQAAKHKLLIFGNGGSAADAQHFSAELMHRVENLPLGVRAFALHTDTSLVTAVSNDEGFDGIFAKQIEVLADPGDIAVAISTSGSSTNIVEGLKMARDRRCSTVGLLGRDGGRSLLLCDLAFIVPHTSTPRIQEVHGMIIHIVCHLLERRLAENPPNR
jgi:D-sedoheptulose 7-phosphate isomerase